MKKNIITLDQMIEEHYGKLGSASRNEFEWGAQLFKISAMIKIARQKLRLTQEEFADLLGMKRSTVANIETGRAEVPVFTYPKLDELGIQKFIGNPDAEEPIRPRATRRQIRLLIDMLAEQGVSEALKLAAKAELYAALDLLGKI